MLRCSPYEQPYDGTQNYCYNFEAHMQGAVTTHTYNARWNAAAASNETAREILRATDMNIVQEGCFSHRLLLSHSSHRDEVRGIESDIRPPNTSFGAWDPDLGGQVHQ